MDADGDKRPVVSRAEKARLHRKRVAALERRKRRNAESDELSRARQRRRRERTVGSALDRPLTPAEEAAFEQEIRDAIGDEDEYQDECDGSEIEEVIELLRRIDEHRLALDRERATLQRWLAGSPALAVDWRRFTSNGGVTAEDFALFAAGRFQQRRTRHKRHLRLVVDNKQARRRIISLGGNDAA
jgi:hypothetical protein